MPPNSDYKGYHTYIDEVLPPESPYLYGLHPNAEIEFLTTNSESLFRTVLELQPRDAGGSGGGGVSREEKVRIQRNINVISKHSHHSESYDWGDQNIMHFQLRKMFVQKRNNIRYHISEDVNFATCINTYVLVIGFLNLICSFSVFFRSSRSWMTS